MTISPRTIQRLAILAVTASSLLGSGCGGDNPAQMAGSIEAPERKVGPPPTARSFAKDKAAATPPAPAR